MTAKIAYMNRIMNGSATLRREVTIDNVTYEVRRRADGWHFWAVTDTGWCEFTSAALSSLNAVRAQISVITGVEVR